MAETSQDQDFIVTEALGKTEHFINQNKKSLSIIIGALILAVGGYYFYDKAVEVLRSYDAKDNVTGAIVFGAIGDAYMELKNTDDAISFYEKASSEKPNNFTTPIMLMKLATALESKGNYKEAKDIYERL